MSDILSLVEHRFTCKNYDTNRKISADDLQKVKKILVNTPSSSNTQPTKYVFIESQQLKEKIADSSWDKNRARIVNASHLIVFCGLNQYTEQHLVDVYHHEKEDGRFKKFAGEKEYFENRAAMYMALPFEQQLQHIDAQVNIALGFFLLGIEGLGINATPMGGFTNGKIDQILGLSQKGLHSVYLVSIGYSGENDFNNGIPKSRLKEQDLIINM